MRQFNQNIVTKRFINIVRSIKQGGSIKSYSEFANKLGYSPQSLNEILKGRRDVTIDVLRKLFIVCNINPNDIFIDKNDSGTESVRVEKAPKESPQALEEYSKAREAGSYSSCQEKDVVIQSLEARLSDKDKQVETLERLVVSKDAMLAMKDQMLEMQAEKIAELEDFKKMQEQQVFKQKRA